MKQWARGLRAQLLLLVLVAVIPAFGLIAYDAISERRDSVAQAERDATNLVHVLAREHGQLLAGARQLLHSLSVMAVVRTPGTAAACHRFVAEVRKLHPYYTNIGVASADGTLFCSALSFSSSINIADRSYFRRALASRGIGVGDYQVGRVTHVRTINVGQAIVDEAGRVRGVVYVALNLDWLNELIAGLDIPPGSTATVFDSNGTVLARYPDPQKSVGQSQRDSPLIHAILGRRGHGTVAAQGMDGVHRLYAFAPLPNGASGGLYATVGITRNAASAVADDAFRRSVISLLLVLGLALVAAWFGSDMLVLRRINALAAAARRIARGDLTVRTRLSNDTEEFGELARAFDSMATALHRVNRALKTLNESNRAIARATDERMLLSEMCRAVVEVGGYRVAWIGYAEHDARKSVRGMAHAGYDGGLPALAEQLLTVSWAPTEQGKGPVATAIRTGKPYVAQHLLTDPNFAPWRQGAVDRGVASAAVFPLTVNDETIGALAIYAVEPDAFGLEELDLLAQATQDLSVGITMLRTRAEHDRAHATIERMAFYDPLTDLPNHAKFEERLRRSLAEARSFNRSLALFMIDITRLRDINDALGFHQGDQLLKEVSARVGAALDDKALLARMRGDEFAVLLQDGNIDRATDVATKMLEGLAAPFALGGLRLDIGVTVGISLFPQDGRDGTQLMRHADVALHQAKKAGKAFEFYTAEQQEDTAQRLALVGELRHAIERNQLTLYYQPKVDMHSGQVCGVEALARWFHPERGMIPPDRFIPVAEQSGLIKALTDWVVGEALRQASVWRKTGLTLPIAVNLSARNLRSPTLVQMVERSLAQYGAAANWLEFEITEGAMMEDPEGALDILTRLREMGITLFIDDFGTGYSSLSYLKKLPVDGMKIDKSFVIDMLANTDSAAIVRSTVGLAHELELKVVAEGIENQTMWDRLAELGCDVAQGYYISKPIPASQFESWLKGWRPSPKTGSKRTRKTVARHSADIRNF